MFHFLLFLFLLPFSAERAVVAAGGVPRTDPEDVHGPGADPDETGLQHEGGDRAPQTRQEKCVLLDPVGPSILNGHI